MDWAEGIKLALGFSSGSLVIKLLDRWFSRRKNVVETEAAINAMAIEQLEAQMARIGQQASANEKLVKRCDELEATCDDLKSKYNEVILENRRLSQENERLKVRITELEKAAMVKPDTLKKNSRPREGLGG